MPANRKTAIPEACPKVIIENTGKRVKKLRGDRGWPLEELANISGVSRSMLSEIARENANPTLILTFRIARVFGLTRQQRIDSAEAGVSKIEVIRTSDRAQVFRSDKQCEIRTLSPLNLEKDVEFYELTVKPGGACRSLPHFEGARGGGDHRRRQRPHRIRRRARRTLPSRQRCLPCRCPHAIINTGKGAAVVFLVVFYR